MQFATTNKMSLRYRLKGQLHLWSKSSVIKSREEQSSILLSFKLFFFFLMLLLHLFTIPSNLLQVHYPTLNYSSNLSPASFYDWTKNYWLAKQPKGILIFTTIVSISLLLSHKQALCTHSEDSGLQYSVCMQIAAHYKIGNTTPAHDYSLSSSQLLQY